MSAETGIWTPREIASMIGGLGLPSAYHHFQTGPSAPDPPFLVFWYPSRDDFRADDRIWQQIRLLRIELYTDQKDFDLEERVGAALDAAGLPYDTDEAWIESERMYMVTYETEVLMTDA